MVDPPPDDIDDRLVADALRRGWGIDVRALAYLPVGGGALHWRADRHDGSPLFVTLDDLDDKDWLGPDRTAVANGLAACLTTATWLRDGAEIHQVIAPVLRRDGQPLLRLADRWTLSAFQFIDGESYPFGRHADAHRRRAVLDVLITLHNAGIHPVTPHHRRPRVGLRASVDPLLAAPERPWRGGPMSERAHEIVRPHVDAVRGCLAAFDAAASAVSSGPVVLTHGEPHAGNVMSVHGTVMLLDWDTVGVAAPERDLWLVLDDAENVDAAHYAASTGHVPRAAVLDLYRWRWTLDDLVHCIALLSGPHEVTQHSQRNLAALPALLGELSTTPWPHT